MKRKIDEVTGVYILKPVNTTYLSVLDKNHDGSTLFSRAVVDFTPHRSANTGLIITGLSKEEAAELETALGYEAGSFNPYNYQDAQLKKKQGKFCWSNYYIHIPKEGIVLDTDASDKAKLDYKLLLAHPKTAKSMAEVAMDPFAQFVLYSKEGEAKVEKSKGDVKKKAYKKWDTLTLNEMYEFLNVYKEGKHRVSKDSTVEVINAEVGKIVEREPEKFLETVESPMYKDMVFLFNCVAVKAILKQGPKYILQGGDLLGNNFLEAVANLGTDDYNGVKVSLMNKLEAVK